MVQRCAPTCHCEAALAADREASCPHPSGTPSGAPWVCAALGALHPFGCPEEGRGRRALRSAPLGRPKGRRDRTAPVFALGRTGCPAGRAGVVRPYLPRRAAPFPDRTAEISSIRPRKISAWATASSRDRKSTRLHSRPT